MIDDLGAIATLRLALLREGRSTAPLARLRPDAGPGALGLTRAQLATPDQVFFVAARDTRIIGILRCRAVRRTALAAPPRQAVVTTAYVIPAERRRGVLRALLLAADRWCRRHGLAGMRLQCAMGNTGGRNAWEALGFRPAEVLFIRSVPPA